VRFRAYAQDCREAAHREGVTPLALTFAARLAWCAAAGLATALAFPPSNQTWLVYIAPVPWLASAATARPAVGAALGACFGSALALWLGAWVPHVLVESFGAHPVAAHTLGLGLALSYVPAIAILSSLLSSVGGRSPMFAPLATVAWSLAELSFERTWPRIPWITLGAPLIDTPLVGLASWWGVYAVSGLVVGISACLSQLLLGWVRAGLLGLLVLALTIASGLGAGEIGADSEGRGAVRVGVVQSAVPMRSSLDWRYDRQSLEALVALSRELPPVDLVVWPETSVSSTLEGHPLLSGPVHRVSTEIDTPILLGAPRNVGGSRRNAAILIRPGGARVPVYDKLRPLPVAEYRPTWLPGWVRAALGSFLPPIPWSFGEAVVTTGLSGLGSPEISICYEAAFSGPSRNPRAAFLVNLVNDGWYDRTAAPEHHLLLARWRAIEAGAPLVRAAATGISAVIDRQGGIVERIELREPGTMVVPIPRSSRVTLFERWGYEPLFLGAALLALLEMARRYRSPSGSRSKLPEITA
jgi:apolipoprotein N-acyltransferase